MRITQSMITNGTQRSINNSYNRMANLQNQLSTGRVINKPSDNPFGAVKAMQYREQLAEVDRLKANTGVAEKWLSMADSTMSSMNDRILRVRDIVMQASNSTASFDSRKQFATELREIKETLGALANTTVDGKYIFGGANTAQAPFDPSDPLGPIVNTDLGQLETEIAPGSQIGINIPAVDLFSRSEIDGQPGGLFATIDNLIQDLEDSTKTSADLSAHLTHVDFQHQNLLEQQAIVGARSLRVEQAIDRLDNRELEVTKFLSKNEDADYAKVITELSTQETAHNAALAVGARMLQQTLVDFLR